MTRFDTQLEGYILGLDILHNKGHSVYTNRNNVAAKLLEGQYHYTT
jgi:hypothetical protein